MKMLPSFCALPLPLPPRGPKPDARSENPKCRGWGEPHQFSRGCPAGRKGLAGALEQPLKAWCQGACAREHWCRAG